ncbi:hypothetical protein TNCV_1910761 [Trichonephila clavipes]|nr:hypothetical protein TNCV_1910761 [Trichonephila clavipes]
MQMTVRFYSVPPQLRGKNPGNGQGPPTSLFLFHQSHERTCSSMAIESTPCRKGTLHLETSMSSPGFEFGPYDPAAAIANYSTGWATAEMSSSLLNCGLK